MLTVLALSSFALAADVPHELKVGGRIQARAAVELPAAEDAGTESAFSIPRARLKASGHAFDEDFTYSLQADFGKGQVSLKDALITLGTDGELKLTMGQFKKPFGREQLTSSGKQGQVDRGITDKAFGNGRDVGLQLHNGIGKKNGFAWAAGAFNGSGDKGTFSGDVQVDPATGTGDLLSAKQSNVPDAIAPLVVARAEWSSDGMKHYSDVDLEGGDLRLAVGANVASSFAEGAGYVREGVDASVKVSGLHVTGGVYYSMAQAGETWGDQQADLLGVYGQASYLIADQYAPVLSAAMVDDTNSTEQDVEALVGFGWFPHQHKLKWQTDVGRVASYGIPGTDAELLRVRTQVQLVF